MNGNARLDSDSYDASQASDSNLSSCHNQNRWCIMLCQWHRFLCSTRWPEPHCISRPIGVCCNLPLIFSEHTLVSVSPSILQIWLSAQAMMSDFQYTISTTLAASSFNLCKCCALTCQLEGEAWGYRIPVLVTAISESSIQRPEVGRLDPRVVSKGNWWLEMVLFRSLHIFSPYHLKLHKGIKHVLWYDSNRLESSHSRSLLSRGTSDYRQFGNGISLQSWCLSHALMCLRNASKPVVQGLFLMMIAWNNSIIAN